MRRRPRVPGARRGPGRAAARTRKSSYTGADVKAAYYQASRRERRRRGRSSRSTGSTPTYHSHTNYVPREALETCPQAQRANATVAVDGNSVTPDGRRARSTEFVVGPKRPDDIRTPSITQGALVFGTSAIADDGHEGGRRRGGQVPGDVRGPRRAVADPRHLQRLQPRRSRPAAGRASSSRSRTPTPPTTSTTRTRRTSSSSGRTSSSTST